MKYWFTGDTHFFHTNIIKYCKRPFKSMEEMNEILIERWNEKIKPFDYVYHVGDFAFQRTDEELENILSRLHGIKFLVFGNHDKQLRKKKDLLRTYFIETSDLLDIKVYEQPIVLSHYSMRVWNKSHFGSWNLYGHSHGTLPDDPKLLSLDVGVDAWNFYPVSFDTIEFKMSLKNFVPLDKSDREK